MEDLNQDIGSFEKKELYISLFSYKNKDTLDILLEEVRNRFKSTKFSVRGSAEKGWQLRLEGNDDETRPRAFAEGFIAAVERMMLELQTKETPK